MASFELRPNTLLQEGKYRIERVLGQGGFGITYLATQELLDRKVCIKEFFFKEYCEREETTNNVSLGTQSNQDTTKRFMAKFLKEASTISSLEHPNIIRIHDIFKENNTAYYVMEYIEGESLNDMVNSNGALPESEAIDYIKQVASALDFIHQRSINHLDVKPANIMVRRLDNKAILIDFGLSKQYDEQGSQTSTTPVGISHGYAPMEQYKQGGVSTFSPQTDIYSLGATFYKLVTGDTPPQAMDILDEGLPSLSSSISSSVTKTIKKAMQPRKVDRPNGIDDFVNGLIALSQDSSFVHPEIKVKENIECDEATKVIANPNVEEVKKQESTTDNLQPNVSTNLAKEETNGNTKAFVLFLILGCIVLCFAWLKNGDENEQYIEVQAPTAQTVNQQNVSSPTKADNRNISNNTQSQISKDSYGICNVKIVDLGLSVKWAGWNVGTNTAEGYGGLYSLGNIPRNSWELGWRLPTEAEQEELRSRCKWDWINYKNGVRGMKITGPNGNAIFLPAAGIRDEDKTIIHRNLYGSYWSSDRSSSTTGGNYFIDFDDFEGKTDESGYPLMSYGYYRYLDKSVRFVFDK